MSDSTKIKFADALETLIHNKSISKITISDIVNTCGLSRRTFYNNFTDIYDLIFWTHEIRTKEAIDGFWIEEDFRQAFRTSMTIMKSHQTFYRQIAKKEGMNSFQNSFMKQNFELSRIRVKNVSGKDVDEETDFLLMLYWCGAAQMLVEWIATGMKKEPKEMAELFYEALPYSLRQYWIK